MLPLHYAVSVGCYASLQSLLQTIEAAKQKCGAEGVAPDGEGDWSLYLQRKLQQASRPDDCTLLGRYAACFQLAHGNLPKAAASIHKVLNHPGRSHALQSKLIFL